MDYSGLTSRIGLEIGRVVVVLMVFSWWVMLIYLAWKIARFMLAS